LTWFGSACLQYDAIGQQGQAHDEREVVKGVIFGHSDTVMIRQQNMTWLVKPIILFQCNANAMAFEDLHIQSFDMTKAQHACDAISGCSGMVMMRQQNMTWWTNGSSTNL
jgi:hypothetical protein